jgi:Lamin Tail Domain
VSLSARCGLKQVLLHAACVLAALVLAQPALPAIRIVKIYYDSPGPDTGNNGSLNHEWIRLRNTGTSTKYLTGWTIRNTSGAVYRFQFFRLRPGNIVTIHSGTGADSATDRYWGRAEYVWSNRRDTARLRRKSGALVEACSYTHWTSHLSCEVH